MSIEKKPNQQIIDTIKFLVRKVVDQRTEIIVDRNDTKNMTGPYLILANHVQNWDPIYINLSVKEPISFIAGESLFRIPVLKNILHYLGTIPKMKSQNDTRTIRGMIKAKKHNRIIGIFPEGNRNWDGVTEPMTIATAKLAKLLNIPVVIGTIKGGHISHPRWGEGNRNGPIHLSLVKAFDTDDFKNDKPEMVLEKLTEAFYFDEMAWQKEHKIAYQSKSSANYLERLLFICANCETPGQMHSNRDLFQCKQCDYAVRYTEYGFLEEKKFSLIYETVAEWNNWQLDFLKNNLHNQAIWQAIMEDEVKFQIADDGQRFRHIAYGTIALDQEKMVVKFQPDNKQDVYLFELTSLEGVNIHLHDKLEFFIGETMYRMEFYNPRSSAYKWLKFIQTLLSDNKKES